MVSAGTWHPTRGGGSPWGEIQQVTTWLAGRVVFVSTASHGGFWVHASIWAQLPGELRVDAMRWARGEPQWFEEDCLAPRLVEAYRPLRWELYGAARESEVWECSPETAARIREDHHAPLDPPESPYICQNCGRAGHESQECGMYPHPEEVDA